jgi:hypothetical protein
MSEWEVEICSITLVDDEKSGVANAFMGLERRRRPRDRGGDGGPLERGGDAHNDDSSLSTCPKLTKNRVDRLCHSLERRVSAKTSLGGKVPHNSKEWL